MSYKPDSEICDVVRADIARDALVSVTPGSIIWNTTTDEPQMYNGSAWGVITVVVS
jgi:hypothetical protein